MRPRVLGHLRVQSAEAEELADLLDTVLAGEVVTDRLTADA